MTARSLVRQGTNILVLCQEHKTPKKEQRRRQNPLNLT
uniref:Uncharacterized protein n=1 Tax=Anguilla anguilla TaxID=7936 RepID=A0A0E9V7H2_ANGAN